MIKEDKQLLPFVAMTDLCLVSLSSYSSLPEVTRSLVFQQGNHYDQPKMHLFITPAVALM